MKKYFCALITLALLLSSVCVVSAAPEEAELDLSKLDTPLSYYQALKDEKCTLNVYNWGEYISDGQDGTLDVNKAFEKLTGIRVNYTNFPSNEDMYAKLKSGATNYDIVVPSDYMVARMIEEKMIQKIDTTQVPNLRFIREDMRNMAFDPTGEYSVPYTWGTVGLIYNTKYVDKEDVTSWSALWNGKYSRKILMFRNSRDAFAIAQLRLGYDLNTTNIKEYEDCAQLLKDQRGVVKIYVMDEVFDKMIGEEAYLAPYYAGDALTMIEDNPDLAFTIPEEGSNRFADSLCIPTGSQNKQAAQMYINFLNETQVALANIEYICYSTPHTAAYALLDEETQNDPIRYPSEEILAKTTAFVNLPKEVNTKIDSLWEDILMTEDATKQRWVFPVVFGSFTLVSFVFLIIKSIRKRRNAEL